MRQMREAGGCSPRGVTMWVGPDRMAGSKRETRGNHGFDADGSKNPMRVSIQRTTTSAVSSIRRPPRGALINTQEQHAFAGKAGSTFPADRIWAAGRGPRGLGEMLERAEVVARYSDVLIEVFASNRVKAVVARK